MKTDFEKKMQRRRDEAKAEGKLQPCECWDCIREAGLTPPLKLRNKFPRRYPHTVFEEDHGGEPMEHVKKSEGEEESKVSPSERAHLRNAIRNREAI